MNRIQELLECKRADVAKRKAARTPIVPEDDRRLKWNRSEFKIIAEIKRASVSAGSIRNIPDPVILASSYEQAGAAAISVLTEEHYFHGSLRDLTEIRKAVRIPILQKDFVLDPFQILEAKEAGVDFVLLIARFLTPQQISDFMELSEQIRINAIVEITDEQDLAKIPPRVNFLGVNSRDLETFEVNVERFERLRSKLPDAFLIAESGIKSPAQLEQVIKLGYNGALIGEHFLRSEDPAMEVKKFTRVARATHPRIKICGVTCKQDAIHAMEAGASALGFVFAKESPRRITPERLHAFRNQIEIPCVGVFRGNQHGEIQQIVDVCRLDIAQIYDTDCNLEIPIWRARTLNDLPDIERLQPHENELIDIKLPESEMESAWNGLKNKNLFALAGGLHAGNVAQAIRICRPVWMDVARGVEIEPGRKDPEKIRRFMEAVRTT